MEQQTGSKLGKEYIKTVYYYPVYFNLYAEYVMRNSGLEYSQAGIKIVRKNINNLRYADDTTLMVESEEQLKCLFIEVFYRPGPGDWSQRKERERKRQKEQYPSGYVESQYTRLVPLMKAQGVLSRSF